VVKDTLLPSAITDLAVLTTSESSITLFWTAPGDDPGHKPVRLYEVRQSMSSLEAYYWNNATIVENSLTPHQAGVAETLEVKNLIPRAKYYFAIKSMDTAGNRSPVSNIVGSDVNDRTPPAAVQDLRVSATTANAVTLVWTAPGDDGWYGIVRTYDVRYGSHVSEGTWSGLARAPFSGIPKPSHSEETIVIDNLVSATDYDFGLRAVDDAGNASAISNVVYAPTRIDTVPPAPVDDLRIASFTPHSATLEWTAPGDDGRTGTVTGYEVRYATFPIDATSWARAQTPSLYVYPKPAGQNQTISIYYLEPSTQYFFAVVGIDEAGNRSFVSNNPSVQTSNGSGGQWRVSHFVGADFYTIQEAIDSVPAGDLILVGPGTYEECIEFGNKDVALRSEKGPDETFVVGCGQPDRPLVHFGAGVTRNAVFEGFTVTGAMKPAGLLMDSGSPTIIGNVIKENRDFGIWVKSGDAVIRNNKIINNGGSAILWGGGMALTVTTADWENEVADKGEKLIENNLFEGNKAWFGAAILIDYANAKIMNNVFTDNSCGYDGGAMFIHPGSGQVLIEGNQFIRNVAGDHGGGIAAWQYQNYHGVSWVDIRRNLFVENEAKGLDSRGNNGVGGAIHVSGLHGTITENTIVKNRAYPLCGGSGITFYLDPQYMPSPVGAWIVERNIIAYNLDGGITCTMGAEDYAKNNLLYQNVHDFGCGNGSCDSSVVRDNWVGDPMFCDPDAGDWHVNENSPAILNPIGPLGAFPVPGCPTPDVSRSMRSGKQ